MVRNICRARGEENVGKEGNGDVGCWVLQIILLKHTTLDGAHFQGEAWMQLNPHRFVSFLAGDHRIMSSSGEISVDYQQGSTDL